MARYTGPVCRICRREGVKLYLKGERCYTSKCAMDRRPYPPGMHGPERRRVKLSDYGIRLREKQRLRRIYGVMERQFRRYFEMASKAKGMTGPTLITILERRLDNVVYRLGFASSRAQARQLVTHGHFTVNGRKIDIPSYLVKPGDVIAVKEESRDKPYFKALAETLAQASVPSWLSLDPLTMSGKVLEIPRREDITDIPVNEQLVVEFYSR